MSTTRHRRRLGRLLAITSLAAIGVAVGIGTASAHVSVDPGSATAGSYTTLTFRVPNESAKASTVGVTINFPTDHPFASVSLKKQPGWSATVTKTKLSSPISDDDNATITEAVSSISWKADNGGQTALGEFAEFEVSVGPVPKVTSLSFPTIQTYSDGSVAKWDEPTPASGAEPENPAPTLTIVPADAVSPGPASSAHGSAGTSSQAAPSTVATVSSAAAPASAAGGSDNAARTLGVIALIVAALALLVGALGLRRRHSAGKS